MLHEKENLQTKCNTVSSVNDSGIISNYLNGISERFFTYLKICNKDIKVWECEKGNCLLFINDRAVVCHIDIVSDEPNGDLENYYLEQFRFHRKYFKNHPNLYCMGKPVR